MTTPKDIKAEYRRLAREFHPDLNPNDKDAKRDFPYFFRQPTGADNSMGVSKFNIQNPFSIFLH